MSRLLVNEHRLGGDNCQKTTREAQNINYHDYAGLNYYQDFGTACQQTEDFEIENFLTRRKGYGFADPGCIDKDSEMRNSVAWTHGRGKTQLEKRVFTAVPGLERGGLIPNVDSRIRVGEDSRQRPTCNVMSEASVYDRVITPLQPCLKDTVQNPKHIVNEVAHPSFTRIGIATRDFIRAEECREPVR